MQRGIIVMDSMQRGKLVMDSIQSGNINSKGKYAKD